MRFVLIDRITELEPGSKITAIKGLTLAEEYLQDHFPLFPVMPGVLMLEAMFQASAWLVRRTDGFAHSMVDLRESRNVKYADFVEPGQTLVVSSEIRKREGALTWLKARGTVDETVAVSAGLLLSSYNLADQAPDQADQDTDTRAYWENQFKVLYQPRQPLSPTV